MEKRNILFILTDQMRGDALSALGHPVVETPNIDDFAKRGGMCFTNAYSTCPTCIAARASIFTGLAPANHGFVGFAANEPWRFSNMLPAVLGQAGYQTHCVGKTHFYPYNSYGGFDSLDSYEHPARQNVGHYNDYEQWLRDQSGGRFKEENSSGVDHCSWYARPSNLPEELHNNSWVVTRAIEFLRRRDTTRPFFLNVSFQRPHPPIDPPQAWYDEYKNVTLPEVPVGDWAKAHDFPVTQMNPTYSGRIPQKALDRCRRAYYAQIAHIDNQIGRLMQAFLRYNIPRPHIVFTSDHGEMLGDHHMFSKSYGYESSAKIPLIVSPADACDRNVGARFNKEPVAIEDVYPTLLELAGVSIPENIDGRSVLPMLKDPSWRHREYIHGEHAYVRQFLEGTQFLTDGKEKYIWYTMSGDEQFFDLARDPQECRNLSASPEYADRLEHWRQRLTAILEKRPEDGLTAAGRLKPGKNLPTVRRGSER
jgi:arylsulfatase A-like enzyme